MPEVSQKATRWTYEDSDPDKCRVRLVENFNYFINKTLYPHAVKKYPNRSPLKAPSFLISKTHEASQCVATPEGLPFTNIHTTYNSFSHSIKLQNRFHKTMEKFIDAFVGCISAMYGEAVMESLLFDSDKIWNSAERTKRTCPLTTASFVDGFIMEGKTSFIERERTNNKRKIVVEADSITRASTLNNKTILEDYPEMIPIVYFFQFSQVLFCDDNHVLIDRSPLSIWPFAKLHRQEALTGYDYWYFYLYVLAICNCIHIEMNLFERTAPEQEVADMPQYRSIEKKLYTTTKILAEDRVTFYALFKRHANLMMTSPITPQELYRIGQSDNVTAQKGDESADEDEAVPSKKSRSDL